MLEICYLSLLNQSWILCLSLLFLQKIISFDIEIWEFCVNISWDADDERPSVTKQRFWMRLFMEIQALQIVSEQSNLMVILTRYAEMSYAKNKSSAQGSYSIISAFAKSGREEFLGMPPIKSPIFELKLTSEVSIIPSFPYRYPNGV